MAEQARRAVEAHRGGPVSVREVLDGIDGEEAAKEAVISRIEVSAAYDAAGIDGRVLAHFGASYGGPESDRIVAGNAAVARGLHAALGDRIRLETRPSRSPGTTPGCGCGPAARCSRATPRSSPCRPRS